MNDLLTTGGAGGAGAFVGAILTFLGFKSRLDALERNMSKLGDNVVYTDTCLANLTGVKDTQKAQNILLKEVRDDIKTILKNSKQGL